MKKILFATTALVASAGFAAAEVKVTGAAEMGIIDGDHLATAQFHTDVDVTFTLSGEADNGLTFGSKVKFEEAAGGIASRVEDDFAVWIAYGGATLTMGDTDGAFDWAMKEVGIGGSIADDHTTHTGFNFNSGLDGTYDGQIARFDYTYDSFAVAISAEIDDTGTFDPVWGIGFKYSGELAGLDLGVGIGYQTVDLGADVDVWGISLDTTFDNGLQAIVNYSDFDIAGTNVTHWGLGLGYTMNALTLSANYGEYSFPGSASDSGFGLAANYDLGGGLSVQFGYGSSSADVAPAVFGIGGGRFAGVTGDNESYSFGLAMSF
ncbi:porin [Mameliella sediminis]|uniref:porin n=1 Tax=Mameliella sediminis TaxID=2836866 RepID=UPI001C44123C|nr:porin [Mameliella sediminis]MBV7394352.1 porin [Mameliella sediminis]MBY6162663.1 porin [Mameliella alba]MBY6172312.1 porin [Mameliella alba]MBY6176150.1 porin [Mameliella alba]